MGASLLVLLAPSRARASADSECAEGCVAAPPATKPPPHGIAITGYEGVTNGSFAEITRGVSAHVAPIAFGSEYRVVFSFAFVEGIENGVTGDRRSYQHAFSDGELAVSLASGAPWSDSAFGWSVGAGASFGKRAVHRSSMKYASPYGEVKLVAQLPTATAWRAFAVATGSWVLSQYGDSTQMATFGLGIAWLGW